MNNSIILEQSAHETAIKIAKLLTEHGIKEVTIDPETDIDGFDYTFAQLEPRRPAETDEYRADKAQWKREKNSHRKYWK